LAAGISKTGKTPTNAGRLPAAGVAITSRENRWLKRFRAALRGCEATEDGYVGVEGARLVEEALQSGVDVEAVLVSSSGEHHLERLARLLDPLVPLLRTSDRLFSGVADTRTPQGVAALVRPPRAGFDDVVRGTALVVVLAGVQDPGNVGTILRSAEALGSTGAIAARGTAYPFAPKALRASAGSALRLPVVIGVALPVAMAQMRMAKIRLYAASLATGLSPAEVDLRGPCALLIGNEGAGLPAEAERSTDAQLRIPLAAPVDSLNAAVAASILLYEASRQRQGSG
jgi:TrmH family RNA methyltransferase